MQKEEANIGKKGAKKEMEKREKATAQGGEMDELACKACALEGCDKGMHCFGGSVNGLCVEGIARYNELRKKELEEETKQFKGLSEQEIAAMEGEDSGMFYDPPDFMSGGILEW